MEVILEAIDDQGERILCRLDDRVSPLNGELLIARSGPRSRTYASAGAHSPAGTIDHALREIAPGWEAHVTRLGPR
jgi:hypothetical protein